MPRAQQQLLLLRWQRFLSCCLATCLGVAPLPFADGLAPAKVDGVMAALDCEPKRRVLEEEGNDKLSDLCEKITNVSIDLLLWSWPRRAEDAVDRAWSAVSTKCIDHGSYDHVVDCLSHASSQVMRLLKWSRHWAPAEDLSALAKGAIPEISANWYALDETPYVGIWDVQKNHDALMRPPPGGWYPAGAPVVSPFSHALTEAAGPISAEFADFRAAWRKLVVPGGPMHEGTGWSSVGLWDKSAGFSLDARRLLPSLCKALEGLLPTTSHPFLFAKQESVSLQLIEQGGYMLPRNGPERVNIVQCLSGCTGAWLQASQDRRFFRENGKTFAFDGIFDHSAGNYGSEEHWAISVVVSHADFAETTFSAAERKGGFFGRPNSRALRRSRFIAGAYACDRGSTNHSKLNMEIGFAGKTLHHNSLMHIGGISWGFDEPHDGGRWYKRYNATFQFHFKFLRHFSDMSPGNASLSQAKKRCQEFLDLLDVAPSTALPGTEATATFPPEEADAQLLLPIWVQPGGDVNEDAAEQATLAVANWHTRRLGQKRAELESAARSADASMAAWRTAVTEQLACMLEHILNLQLVNTFTLAVERGIGEGMPQLAHLPPIIYHTDRLRDRVGVVLSALGSLAQEPDRRFVEVGVYKGNFVMGFLRNSRMRYLGIDPYDKELSSLYKVNGSGNKMYDLVSSAIREIADPDREAELLRKTSLDVAASIGEETVDAVFLDGNLYYHDVIEDMVTWWPKVKPGGILFGHDFFHVDADMMVAISIFCQSVGCDRMHLGLDSVFWIEKPVG